MTLIRTTDPDDVGNCVLAGCSTLTYGRVTVAGQPMPFCPEHPDDKAPEGAERSVADAKAARAPRDKQARGYPNKN